MPHRRLSNHTNTSTSVITRLPGHTHHPSALVYPATRQPESARHTTAAPPAISTDAAPPHNLTRSFNGMPPAGALRKPPQNPGCAYDGSSGPLVSPDSFSEVYPLAKPSDFFVGITDLFSIILPGASMTYVCIKVEEQRGADLLGLLKLNHTNEGYVAFFVVSYLIGHGMDLIGSVVLDDLFDLTYAHWKRSLNIPLARWMSELPGRLTREFYRECKRIFVSSGPKSARSTDPLFLRAKQLAAPVMLQEDRTYQWCRAWIALRSPTAFSETERVQANSKFFRGLVTAAAITAILSLTLQVPFHKLGAAVCAALALASFMRYCDLRWKAVQQTYRFFIALQYEPPVPGAATADSDDDS